MFFAFLFAVILLSVTSCTKCPVSNTYNFYLSDTIKTQISYTGNDTLVYVSNYKDTAILYGQGITQSFDREFFPHKSADCDTYDNYYLEELKYTYRGKNSNFNYFGFVLYGRTFSEYGKDEWIRTYLISDYFAPKIRMYLSRFNNEEIYNYLVKIKNKDYFGVAHEKTIYNKKYGFLQININDTLTYTLNNIKE